MTINTKNLHIVVHHRKDANQPWVNSWVDDDLLEAITTTIEIGDLCQQAQEMDQPIYVHRCSWNNCQPVLSCIANIAQASKIDKRTWLVTFKNRQVLGKIPLFSPHPGQNYYWA